VARSVKKLRPADARDIIELQELLPSDGELSPREIVEELDRYVISQHDAKRAVAIALRNRWRRLRVAPPMRDEITPKNIIMIGPTGVGKTEISRRLAKLAKAPFVKVEASKFTEVGYVGRDVESIIRDLMEIAFQVVKEEEQIKIRTQAEQKVEEQLLDLLEDDGTPRKASKPDMKAGLEPALNIGFAMAEELEALEAEGARKPKRVRNPKQRAILREKLRAGELEEQRVEIEQSRSIQTQMQIVGPHGLGEIEGQIKDMFANMIPKQKDRRRMTVSEARGVLLEDAEEELVDHETIRERAVRRAEQTGIVFIDEIDKICGMEGAKGPDVSRQGVQRDLLPLVEGATVSTKYGPVRTDHMLFIASGAFHIAKPSDLMPEFQGRFPIRVELKSLSPEDFYRILTEPENALTKQYQALLGTEEVTLEFKDDALREIARLTAEVNTSTENIGARRLHTILERLLDEVSFDAELHRGSTFVLTKEYVTKKLGDVVQDVDLARFIL
jgi:ATP-dependent HslUV protease ATP-binding subunit HslU